MSEIQSIANGTYMIGETSQTEFQAGPGISITKPSEGTVRIANDETVLFSGDLTPSSTAQLTESWKNFEEIRCYGYSGPGGAMFGCGRTNDLLSAYSDDSWCPDIGLNTVASWVHRSNFSINANMPLVFSADTSVTSLNGRLLGYWNDRWQLSTNEQRCHCTLILGINRKENA
jgi:hypothetical protein